MPASAQLVATSIVDFRLWPGFVQALRAFARVGLGLDARVGPPADVRALRDELAGQVADHAGRHAVGDEVHVARAERVAQLHHLVDDRRRAPRAVARTDHGGQRAERALAVVAAAVDVVGDHELGREVLVERQSVELGDRRLVELDRMTGSVEDGARD